MIVHLCIRRSLEFYVRKLEILEALKTVCTFIAKTRVFKTHLTPLPPPPYHPERASAYAFEGIEILLYTSSFRSGEVHIIKCF